MNKDLNMLNDLLSMSSDGNYLTLEELGQYREQRHNDSMLNNPNFTFSKSTETLAFGESALIMGLFGDDSKVPLSYVKSFLGEEKLPLDVSWQKRALPMTLPEVIFVLEKLKHSAGVGIFSK